VCGRRQRHGRWQCVGRIQARWKACTGQNWKNGQGEVVPGTHAQNEMEMGATACLHGRLVFCARSACEWRSATCGAYGLVSGAYAARACQYGVVRAHEYNGNRACTPTRCHRTTKKMLSQVGQTVLARYAGASACGGVERWNAFVPLGAGEGHAAKMHMVGGVNCVEGGVEM